MNSHFAAPGLAILCQLLQTQFCWCQKKQEWWQTLFKRVAMLDVPNSVGVGCVIESLL